MLGCATALSREFEVETFWNLGGPEVYVSQLESTQLDQSRYIITYCYIHTIPSCLKITAIQKLSTSVDLFHVAVKCETSAQSKACHESGDFSLLALYFYVIIAYLSY